MKKNKKNIEQNDIKNNLAYIIFIISIIAIVGIISFIIISSIVDSKNAKTNWTAMQIAEELSSKIDVSIVEDTSKKQLYSSRVKLYDYNVEDNDNDWSIAIEVFENNQKAKIRYDYLNWEKNTGRNLISKEEYGEFYEEIFELNSDNFLDGNVILLLNSKYSSDSKEELHNAFIEVEKSYTQKEENISSDENYVENELQKLIQNKTEEINSYKDKIVEQLNDIIKTIDNASEPETRMIEKELEKYASVSIIKEEYNNANSLLETRKNHFKQIKIDKANDITSKLSEIEKSLDKTELANIKETINNLKDSFYDSYKTEWQNTITKIEDKIKEKEISDYKNSCKNLNYKNVLRTPDDYKYTKAYWFGKVVQVVGSGFYRISVDCKKYQYISGYSCSNTLYVYYSGDENLIEDDMVKMWGYMNGNKTYTTIWDSTVTIPYFVAEYLTLQ